MGCGKAGDRSMGRGGACRAGARDRVRVPRRGGSAVHHLGRATAGPLCGAIPAYVSLSDRDGDGIDDQTDILRGALAYVQIRPHYKSVYYAAGYPDDGYGVCTDVVAAALRAAGYDLMRLVADDIAAAPEAYGIETPDAAIDYRRTGNLEVYFARNAEALTCEVSDIEAWQGGDIVLFDGHVGIVSDRRDARGVPYLIHHGSPFQLAYEEDRLDSYGTIVGHYRLGR